jgi:hypothetical protein
MTTTDSYAAGSNKSTIMRRRSFVLLVGVGAAVVIFRDRLARTCTRATGTWVGRGR